MLNFSLTQAPRLLCLLNFQALSHQRKAGRVFCQHVISISLSWCDRKWREKLRAALIIVMKLKKGCCLSEMSTSPTPFHTCLLPEFPGDALQEQLHVLASIDIQIRTLRSLFLFIIIVNNIKTLRFSEKKMRAYNNPQFRCLTLAGIYEYSDHIV